MSGNDEARRAALEARQLLREVGRQVTADDRRGRDLRRPETVRAIVSEEMAWALLYGVEPRLGVEEEANFYTITCFRALQANDSASYEPLFGRPAPPGLWPERAETLDPTVPEGRWREFLASDDRALGTLGRLEELADRAEVPEDFVLPLRERRRSTPPEGAEDRVRRLGWLPASRDRECLRLAAELFRRRDSFVWGPAPRWRGSSAVMDASTGQGEGMTDGAAPSRRGAAGAGAGPVQAPGKERSVSEREKAEEERRRLEAAGWEAWQPGHGEGPAFWRNPRDGHWHTQQKAIAILEEDEGGVA